jgi:hypothetical protein
MQRNWLINLYVPLIEEGIHRIVKSLMNFAPLPTLLLGVKK